MISLVEGYCFTTMPPSCPLNPGSSVIEREPLGSITEFFNGKTIFVTGGSGFLGKVLMYKLLRDCPDVAAVLVLIREKKGAEPQERLHKILESPIFAEFDSAMLSKVKPIAGDLLLPRLGLSDADAGMLMAETGVVFHSAATVKFDEELSLSLRMNVVGTGEMLALAKKMQKLEAFVHVSTAYAHCNRKRIHEKIYKDPSIMLSSIWRQGDMASQKPFSMDETLNIIGDRPNSYTYTKAMAEHLVQEEKGELPIIIVRPSIVVAALRYPMPGWIDNYNGPTGKRTTIIIPKNLNRTRQEHYFNSI